MEASLHLETSIKRKSRKDEPHIKENPCQTMARYSVKMGQSAAYCSPLHVGGP